MPASHRVNIGRLFASITLCGAVGLAAAAFLPPLTLPTTLNDFLQPGTQPNTLNTPIISSSSCTGCHSGYDPEQEPYDHWQASMMGQAGRDPIFYAALAIANQDAAFSGEMCLRCHAPGAWLDGRSTPTDGSALDPLLGDLDGVTCNFCHRLVDAEASVENPPEDTAILAALTQIPPTPNNGQYIIDPDDRRRGPFDLGPSFFFHSWAQSNHHREAQLCGTCHDVSNPTLSKQLDGTYQLNAVNQEHPTHDKRDEFPIERTFGEWSQSIFARGPVDAYGRFGGNKTRVSTCQDCHMPDTDGTACQPVLGGAVRTDLPKHNFNGVNSWVIKAVRALYPDFETGLTNENVNGALARNREMQEKALDLYAWVDGGDLRVRIANMTGHKLPTGYGEGRRMWINVQFLGAGEVLLGEHGAYDLTSAVLTTSTTKVYQMEQGLDATQAAASGVPAGPSFHFVLNNTTVSDNRIPPRGFTNANFASVQAAPTAATFADEQYWDDTLFALPPGTTHAIVNVYHQTTTKEYIEFLRDANTTNTAGITAYNQWVAFGKSEPVRKATLTLAGLTGTHADPIAYGTGKTQSNGRVANLGWAGYPSVSGPGFQVVVRNGRPGSSGVVRSSLAMASTPFEGGTMLLGGPIFTTGSFVFDGTGQALVRVPMSGVLLGTARNFQAFFRDRADPYHQGMSNALHVDFTP